MALQAPAPFSRPQSDAPSVRQVSPETCQPASQAARNRTVTILRTAAVTAAGGAILVWLLTRIGWGTIQSSVSQMGWRFLIVVLLFGIHEGIRAAALAHCLRKSLQLPFRTLLRIRFLGETVRALTPTGPILAEASRAWFIQKEGVSTTEAAAATIAEYAAHGVAAALLSVCAAGYVVIQPELPRALRISALLLLCGSATYLAVVALALHQKVRPVAHFADKVRRWKRFEALAEYSVHPLARTEHALCSLTEHPGALWRIMTLEAASHVLLFLETWFAILTLSPGVSAFRGFLAEVLSKLVNASLFVGAAEGVHALLFRALGLAAATGLILSLVKRARSLAVGVLGLAGLALLPQRSRNS